MTTESKAPVWFWIVAILLLLWEAMGCYACITQIRLGAAAMGPVDEWSLKYYASLPAWYNGVYSIATFGGLIGSLMLLLRNGRARFPFWVSFVAIIVMFGYAYIETDLIAHKGLGQTLPFPLLIAVVGGLAIWFASLAARKGWAYR